jgi:hypothetical protein
VSTGQVSFIPIGKGCTKNNLIGQAKSFILCPIVRLYQPFDIEMADFCSSNVSPRDLGGHVSNNC